MSFPYLLSFLAMISTSAVTSTKARADGNMSGLAGELFVAAELLKRGLQASITFGNAKQVDLLAIHPETKEKFSIQVKALRTRGYFPIRAVKPEHVYVFVVLNVPGKAVQYFIARGEDVMNEPDLLDPKFPGIHWKNLAKFEDAWNTFGC